MANKISVNVSCLRNIRYISRKRCLIKRYGSIPTRFMEQKGNMKLYSFDEVKGEFLGKVGAAERDEQERKVEEAPHAYRIGEAIKKARLKQNLTQEQLGASIGVQKAQISRMERGYSISIPTMSRVFKALGIATATLDLGVAGKVALW